MDSTFFSTYLVSIWNSNYEYTYFFVSNTKNTRTRIIFLRTIKFNSVGRASIF